jgi:hypothetical protein
MDFLIKAIAIELAGWLERGSRSGAIIGTLLGLIAGVTSAHWVAGAGWLDPHYSVAIYLIISIPLAIFGAFVGSAVGPRKRRTGAAVGLRLTRYNRAGGSLAIALILMACLVGSVVVLRIPTKEEVTTMHFAAIVAAFALLFLGWAVKAAREIWYVELAPTVCVRRLLGTRFYTRHDVRAWGFEIRPGTLVQQTFAGKFDLCVAFGDGYRFRVEVDGQDSEAIVDFFRGG